MINRENWKLIKKFLKYREVVSQNHPLTIRSGWGALKHTLQWADETHFRNAAKLRPPLPTYLLTSRKDGKQEPLSPARMEKILIFSRNFFEWLRMEYPSYNKNVPLMWIESLQVPRSHGKQSHLVRRVFWTLEDVIKVLDYPTTSIRHMRDKAALAFIYASAMRAGAFVTLPVRSVELETSKVYQLPEWGVQTKNSKAAVTYLLPIPRLRTAIEEWDAYIRPRVSSDKVAWYTVLNHDGLDINCDDVVTDRAVSGRRNAFYQGLRNLCDMAGVEWKSPHKIRHGHGVYGIMHAKTMAEYKALSQNMMHETVATTDKTYSVLASDEVGDIIKSFKP
jgi:integrase